MNEAVKTSLEERNWHFLDAKDQVLGRLATQAADLLRGKHKVGFRRHIDAGDIVVITNAKHIVVTGNKETDKQYIYHTGFPKGLRTMNVATLRKTKPEEIIIKAITGMLPKTTQRDIWLKRLKVYADANHPHQANIK